MSKKNSNPLPGRGEPLNTGAYNWTRSFSHGGSEMIGDANRSGKKSKYRRSNRSSAIFTLFVIGLGFLLPLILALIELF